MGIFGFGKKRSNTVDFTKLPDIPPSAMANDMKNLGEDIDLRDNKDVNAINPLNANNESKVNSGSNLDFLNTMANNSPPSSSNVQSSGNILSQVSEMSEVRTTMRKLSSQVEESSNDVYRLIQRLELLERKIERFESRGR